jgi:hypothetical protein
MKPIRICACSGVITLKGHGPWPLRCTDCREARKRTAGSRWYRENRQSNPEWIAENKRRAKAWREKNAKRVRAYAAARVSSPVSLEA